MLFLVEVATTKAALVGSDTIRLFCDMSSDGLLLILVGSIDCCGERVCSSASN